MSGQPSWYPGFLEWWNTNVTNAPDPATARQNAQYGNQYFADLMNKDEKAKIEKKQADAQNKAAALGVGAAVSAPVLYAGGKKVASLLGLGEEAAKTEAVKDVAQAAGAGGADAAAGAVSGGGGIGGGAGGGAAGVGFFDSGGGLLGGGEMGTGAYLPGVAGAYGAYDLFANKRGGVRAPLQGAASGAGIGFTLGGPVGAGIGAGVGGLLGLGQMAFGNHETTRQRAMRHTSELGDVAPDDQAYQNYLSGMREQFNSGPPDPSKPFHGGQYGSWDEYKKAGLDAGDLTGVYGNIKTFGPKWAGLTEDQRRAVTQGLIDANLYNSNKGEVEITDPTKAMDIYNSVASNGYQMPTVTPPPPPQLPQMQYGNLPPGVLK